MEDEAEALAEAKLSQIFVYFQGGGLKRGPGTKDRRDSVKEVTAALLGKEAREELSHEDHVPIKNKVNGGSFDGMTIAIEPRRQL